MIENVPNRRRSFARSLAGRWHRAGGAIGGIVFFFLAVTGVAIHHSAGLGLDHRVVRAPWLLGFWGIEPTFVGIETDSGWVVTDGESTFPPVGDSLSSSRLVAAIAIDDLIATTSGDRLWLLTAKGDLLDLWSSDVLPGSIRRLGVAKGRLIVDFDAGLFAADSDYTHLESFESTTRVIWADSPSQVPDSVLVALRQRGAGPGLSVERILLDLHSGRAFGSMGPWLMDLVALALSLVVFTGLIGWWRRWGNDSADARRRRK